jgi:HSP20 family protein
MMGRWEPWWPALRWPHEVVAPALDMYEEGDALVLEVEVPGLEKGDVEINVTGDVLTITGKKEKEEKVERKDYFRFERTAGAFTRSVRLPFDVQIDKMTAKLEKGVLEVRAPKTEAAKAGSRKIQIA